MSKSLDAACALAFADPRARVCVLDVTVKDKVLFRHPITMRGEPSPSDISLTEYLNVVLDPDLDRIVGKDRVLTIPA